MPSRKLASRRSRKSTVGKITPPLDVRSEDSISSLMKLIAKGPITIVLVYADWCGHCHTYKPKFDQAAKNRKSPFQVASINETMINSVNKRINSMNKSAQPINVSGYPSVISLTKNGDSLKDLSQEAAIKMLNTPMPNTKNSPKENAKNVMENAPKNVIENAPENVIENAPENAVQESPMMGVSQKKPNVEQTYVSQPRLRIGGNYDTPIASKYLGGSLYKQLSLLPYTMKNPSTLLKRLSRKKSKSKSRKSKSRK